MKKTIEKLQQKPHKERQKIAFGGAFVVTFIIALVWLSVVVMNFGTTPQTAQTSGPLEDVWANVSGAFDR